MKPFSKHYRTTRKLLQNSQTMPHTTEVKNNNLFLLNSGEASTDAQIGVGGGGLGKPGGNPWSDDE